MSEAYSNKSKSTNPAEARVNGPESFNSGEAVGTQHFNPAETAASRSEPVNVIEQALNVIFEVVEAVYKSPKFTVLGDIDFRLPWALGAIIFLC